MNAIFGGLLAAAAADVERQWSDMFLGLDQEQRFVVLMVGIGCATGIILGLAGIVTGMIGSIHRRRVEAEMKREMLDRGLSADEIAKVIEAVPPPDDAVARCITSWGKKK